MSYNVDRKPAELTAVCKERGIVLFGDAADSEEGVVSVLSWHPDSQQLQEEDDVVEEELEDGRSEGGDFIESDGEMFDDTSRKVKERIKEKLRGGWVVGDKSAPVLDFSPDKAAIEKEALRRERGAEAAQYALRREGSLPSVGGGATAGRSTATTLRLLLCRLIRSITHQACSPGQRHRRRLPTAAAAAAAYWTASSARRRSGSSTSSTRRPRRRSGAHCSPDRHRRRCVRYAAGRAALRAVRRRKRRRRSETRCGRRRRWRWRPCSATPRFRPLSAFPPL